MCDATGRLVMATSANLVRMRGERFCRVEYFHSDPGWPRDYRLDATIHEPDAAVRLEAMSGEFYLFTWEMIGEHELLAVRSKEQGEVDQVCAGGADVSRIEPWPELLGRPIVDACLSRSGWSDACIRITFDVGSVDVSLGEWQADRLVYLPTSLVVEFGATPHPGAVP